MSTRDEIAMRHLRGEGIEIGPGTVPTRVADGVGVAYVDKRSAEELRAYFGNDTIVVGSRLDAFEKGSRDFIIANHVLEHCSNALDALVEWMRYLKPSGRMLVSVPNRFDCADGGRLVTPPTHFLSDYVHGVDDGSFESREHIYSFLCGWSETSALANLARPDAMALINQAAHAPVNDLHWHVFSCATLRFVVEMAAALSGRTCRLLHVDDGYTQKSNEHRLVVQLDPAATSDPDAVFLLKMRQGLAARLTGIALGRLEGRPMHMLTPPHAGKIFVAEAGKLHWVREPEQLRRRGLADQETVYIECGNQPGIIGEDIISAEMLLAMDRGRAVTSRIVRKNGHGLEVSPGARGLLPKDVFDVVTCDKVDPEEYKRRYQEAQCPPIDRIIGDAPLDTVFGDERFDFIVSSHVIEHIPDFIGFFISAAKLLHPGGQIIKLVPDRRFTFDVLRRNSTIDDIERAHTGRLTRPSLEMIEDFFRHVDQGVTAPAIWSGQYKPSPMHDAATVAERLKAYTPKTADCHCFTFTPESFHTLIGHVIAHYVPTLRIVEITETPRDCSEFLIHLSKVGS